MDNEQAELIDHNLDMVAALIELDEQQGRGYGGRALQAAAYYVLDGNPCSCVRCTLALSLAMAIGADRIARMTPEQLIAESRACVERYAASQPEDEVQDDIQAFRTIAANMRRLFPIS